MQACCVEQADQRSFTTPEECIGQPSDSILASESQARRTRPLRISLHGAHCLTATHILPGTCRTAPCTTSRRHAFHQQLCSLRCSRALQQLRRCRPPWRRPWPSEPAASSSRRRTQRSWPYEQSPGQPQRQRASSRPAGRGGSGTHVSNRLRGMVGEGQESVMLGHSRCLLGDRSCMWMPKQDAMLQLLCWACSWARCCMPCWQWADMKAGNACCCSSALECCH